MKYQLVLQWAYSSVADYDLLIRLEDLIRDGIGNIGIVDGHDYGSGEMNIFVHTNEPRVAFEKIGILLSGQLPRKEMKAGYRNFEDDHYTPIYPPGLQQFSVI
jgi:hypothetical protein